MKALIPVAAIICATSIGWYICISRDSTFRGANGSAQQLRPTLTATEPSESGSQRWKVIGANHFARPTGGTTEVSDVSGFKPLRGRTTIRRTIESSIELSNIAARRQSFYLNPVRAVAHAREESRWSGDNSNPIREVSRPHTDTIQLLRNLSGSAPPGANGDTAAPAAVIPEKGLAADKSETPGTTRTESGAPNDFDPREMLGLKQPGDRQDLLFTTAEQHYRSLFGAPAFYSAKEAQARREHAASPFGL
jgi:hypothetical protein